MAHKIRVGEEERIWAMKLGGRQRKSKKEVGRRVGSRAL
jgi:hypothetical protein